MRIRDPKSGIFLKKWRTKADKVYLPFANQLKAIAKIADKHPQPEAFLAIVERVARELAEGDGVELEV